MAAAGLSSLLSPETDVLEADSMQSNGNGRQQQTGATAERCDRCKEWRKSAVSYCQTCEKRLCPHHEMVRVF